MVDFQIPNFEKFNFERIQSKKSLESMYRLGAPTFLLKNFQLKTFESKVLNRKVVKLIGFKLGRKRKCKTEREQAM